MSYVWEFGVVFNQFDLLLAGLLNTLKITGGALLFGIPLGLFAAILRLSRYAWLRVPVGILIEFFRTTPPIVQLFWFFFALPMLSGIEMDPFRASLVTFSIQSSAFFCGSISWRDCFDRAWTVGSSSGDWNELSGIDA